MGLSLFILFSYNRYHNAVYSSVANELTGRVNEKYSSLEYYFQLKRTNDSLVRANENLYNKLRADFHVPDTLSNYVIDTIRIDSLEQYRRYQYLQARVVANSLNQPNNFIQIHRGNAQQINADLGVIDLNNAVVGTTIETSKNFTVVMSLLNIQSNVSAKLKKSGETGSIVWDGKETNLVSLKDISKAVKVANGDTVITSGFSEKFPFGLLIGVVSDVVNDPSQSTYIIKVKTAANFYNLSYVYVINNLQKAESTELLNSVKAKTK